MRHRILVTRPASSDSWAIVQKSIGWPLRNKALEAIRLPGDREHGWIILDVVQREIEDFISGK